MVGHARGLVAVGGAALAAAVFGGLVFLAAAPAQTAANAPETRFTVPVGRIGDEVQYEGHFRKWQGENGNSTDYEARFQLAFRVAGVEEVLDSTMRRHSALRVEYSWKLPADWNWPRTGTVEFIGLDSRDVLQFGEVLPFTDPSGRGLPLNAAILFSYIRIGPVAEDPLLTGHDFDHGNSSFEHQGRTYQLGEDRSARDLSDPGRFVLTGQSVLEDCRRCQNRLYEIHEASFRSRVGEAGWIGDRPVFSVERETRLDYARFYDGLGSWARGWNAQYRATDWLSPDSPYPVRTQRDIVRTSAQPVADDGQVVDDIHNNTIVFDLVRYQPGGAPIPWAEADSNDRPYRSHNPALERGDDSYPVDGTRSPFAFALSDALAAVRGDESLTSLRRWQAAHPDAVLVGLRHMPGINHSPGDWSGVQRRLGLGSESWDLILASPTAQGAPDQGFIVSSMKNATTAIIINVERGAAPMVSGGRFTAADLPKGPVTWFAFHQAWRSVVTQDSSQSPSWAWWGTHWRRETNGTLVITGRITGLKYADIGYCDPTRIAGSNDPSAPIWVDDCRRLEMNVESGNVTYHYNMLIEYRPVPIVGTDGALLPVRAAQAEAASGSPLQPVLPALWASTSLLAAFLAVYFYPLLKYAFGHALLGLPGYAKLRRKELLNNRFREQLLEAIRADPGISPPELHALVGGAWTTVVYHLGVLEKNKVVSSIIDSRHKRFFPTDAIDWSKRGQLSALRNERTRSVYDHVRDQPGIHQRALARELSLSAPAAAWHLKRLQAVGLVGYEKMGRRLQYYAAVERQTVDAPGMDTA